MKRILRKILPILLSTMFVFTGCASSNSDGKTSTNGGSTSKTKTFVYPIEHDVATLEPATGNDSITVAIKPLYDYLYIVTNDGIRYYAADKLEVSEDGLNIKMHINDKANWHDGKPLIVDDLLFTLKYFDLKNNTKLNKVAGKPIEYKKIDDKNIEIILPEVFSDFVTILGRTMLYPSHLFDNDATKIDGSDQLMKGIGYGPFTLKEWNKGENIVYEKNPNYYRGVPKIDEMIMKIIPEESAKEVALQNGELSFMRLSSKEKHEKYKKETNFNLCNFTEARMNYIQVNPSTDNKLTKEMKEAIFAAINLDEIMQAVYGSDDMAVAAQGVFCKDDIYYDKNFENYDFDLDKATKLAKESGLDKKTLKYIYNNNRVNMPEIAVVVQQQLKKAGINIKLQGMDSPSFFAKFFDVTNPQGDWDLGTNGWDSQMGDSGYVHGYLRIANKGYSRFMESDETNKMLTEARKTANLTERTKKYRDGQKLLKDDYTVYPVSYPNYVIVSQKNVKGIDAIPSMLPFEDYLTLDIEK